MFGITDLTTYILGTIFIVLLPGPNSLFVLTVSARGGVRAGIAAAAGIVSCDLVLMTLAAAGAASLLLASPWLYNAVKWVGAAYLAWIGIQLLKSAWQGWQSKLSDSETLDSLSGEFSNQPEEKVEGENVREKIEGRADESLLPVYRRALLVGFFNPKAIFFFVSFFVQFVDPGYAHPVVSFVVLGIILQTISVAYMVVLILAGGRCSAWFHKMPRLTAGLTGGVGAAFVAFGGKLAAASME